MLGAFSLAWLWLVVNRYQLARLDWEAEESARRGRLPGLAAAVLPRSRLRLEGGGSSGGAKGSGDCILWIGVFRLLRLESSFQPAGGLCR